MFDQLFEKQLMISLSRQMALNDTFGDGSWQVDIPSGTLDIEGHGQFPMQVLGTESHQSNTWLWAWANEQSDLPAAILRDVEAILDFGREKGIGELTTPTFALDTIDAHQLAIVCTSLAPQNCYYVCSYDGGALFTLIDHAPDSVNHAPLERINTVIMHAIRNYPIHHRNACTAYLTQQGMFLEEAGDLLAAERPGEGRLELTFSSDGRLENIQAHLGGADPTPATKPWWKFW
ncbi:DUF6882 domain-containing protein [Acanthopleuribacter pedis]|uniref:Uncharacterized protein n=1 Tax=Acanthopleuribacter pedis TaxID=442870 RepID=A0A8J7U7Y2_9BACT|nr:DUF6882 domain-containing protein [Acanthopleuribacter pedis]MBO1323489.1 hypothetical protein [Acanthopleuribacter pedis]